MRINKIWILVSCLVVGLGCGSEVGGDDEENDWEFCEEEPQCEDGFSEVSQASECEADRECEEVTVCGETIFCEGEPPCEEIPVCESWRIERSSPDQCHPDAACLERERCGEPIWCEEPENEDECPTLSCPAGKERFDRYGECPDDDGICHQIDDNACGHDIWCYEDADSCDLEPWCPQGSEEVDECPDDDLDSCWEIAKCGYFIFCEEEEQ